MVTNGRSKRFRSSAAAGEWPGVQELRGTEFEVCEMLMECALVQLVAWIYDSVFVIEFAVMHQLPKE